GQAAVPRPEGVLVAQRIPKRLHIVQDLTLMEPPGDIDGVERQLPDLDWIPALRSAARRLPVRHHYPTLVEIPCQARQRVTGRDPPKNLLDDRRCRVLDRLIVAVVPLGFLTHELGGPGVVDPGVARGGPPRA